MSILDTLITDRVPGAAYGFPDMNRVGEAMEYVAQRLRACGLSVEVTPRTDLTRTDFPTVALLDHYILQLQTLHDAIELLPTFPPVPVVGTAKNYMTYSEANDIEQLLMDIDDSVLRLLQSCFSAGEICAGEV